MKQKYPLASLGVLSQSLLSSKDEGRDLLELICDRSALLRPDTINIEDGRERVAYSAEVRARLESDWYGYLQWRQRETSLLGLIAKRNQRSPHHSDITVTGRFTPLHTEGLQSFIREVCARFIVDLAYLAVPAGSEAARGLAGRSLIESRRPRGLSTFVHTALLERCLPDLWWGTFFGPVYGSMFGRETLLSCPAFAVEEWGNGVWIRLTKSPYDNPDEIEVVRVRCKEHLGADAFFDPDRPAWWMARGANGSEIYSPSDPNPPDHPYRVPDFSYLTPPRDW